MFSHITVASAFLQDGESAPAEIDRVLSACLVHQQPVYICLPSDVVQMPCAAPGPFVPPVEPVSDKFTLDEALDEAAAMLSVASMPVVLADVELIRYHLEDELASFLSKTGLPQSGNFHPEHSFYGFLPSDPQVERHIILRVVTLAHVNCFVSSHKLHIHKVRINPRDCPKKAGR